MASAKGSYHARSPHDLYMEETKQNTEEKKRIERQNPTLSVATTRAKAVSFVKFFVVFVAFISLFFHATTLHTSSTLLYYFMIHGISIQVALT